ncbi:TetR/AcrR family transcriptional regulator [Acidiferrimicrobium sp. IK]|uniref:TetR/AcrR family transcriptional regulator n=1 Tax=Acidiferrimicrobium sp. IK TaxID=2871700 RepID=UPI0021CB6E75|nr:TetR/AcrR family transcriptional regulator [Acidiferrimicrobium sp. IK]MCU4183278.1 TetR/AcrR family transcriptional regulator [Acidiferrimicrobium sp. IK]
MGDLTTSRRDRLRAETVAEIKQLAWAQLAQVGPRAMSLRAIARQMGVTSSALYRYFSSVEALLGALITDGYASLADSLEATDAAARAEGCRAGERWLRAARAHREWAINDPTAYTLLFGASCDDYEPVAPRIKVEMSRGHDALFRIMLEGIGSGQLDPSGLDRRLSDEMRGQLLEWGAEMDHDLGPAALSACLMAWHLLLGTVSTEVFGMLPPVLRPGKVVFEQNMRNVLDLLGCRD